MHTVLDILKASTSYLEKRDITPARRSAEDLLADSLGMRRLDLYMNFDRPLTEAELQVCRERLKRRGTGEPAAYIQGEVEFYGCQLTVSPAVLIPRPETEILADRLVKQLSKENHTDKILWDLCTGSGCLAIAIKKKLPDLQVIASDLSPEALSVARQNAKKNDVAIEFKLGDLLTPFSGLSADFLVCNPPYVTEGEYLSLDPQVKDFEPKSALVSGPAGTEIYARLARELPNYLNRGAKLWFEIGTGQGTALKEIFRLPPWRHQHLDCDWSGQERFFSLEIE